MADKHLQTLDMSLLEILNQVVHKLSANPGSPVEGQIYYNTTVHCFEFYNGTVFITQGTLDQITKAAADVDINSHKLLNVSNPISGTDAANRQYVLALTPNELTALAADYSFNSHKGTNVTDPTSAQDIATKNYVDGQVSGARETKDSVRITTAAALPAYTRVGNVLTANANGALTGTASMDGLTPAVNDRVLVNNVGSATGADRGIYVVTTVGTGSVPWVLTRSSDATTSAEMLQGTFVWTDEGTANAGTGWLLITANPITLNTTSLSFTQIATVQTIVAGAGLTKTGSTVDVIAGSATATGGPGGGLVVAADSIAIDSGVVPGKYSTDVGDGAATSYVLTHNLGTKDVVVSVYDKTTPFAEVYCEVRKTSTTTITLVFAVAPTASQYRATVIG